MSRLQELLDELCPDGVERRPLEECCEVLDRLRKPISKAAREAGEYPYYGANGIQDYVSDYIFDGQFVLVGEDGSVVTPYGKPVVNWAEGKIWVNNHAHIIQEKEGVLLRFIYHYLQTVDVTPYIHGNIPKFTGGDFKALGMPVPPLEVQREIVRVLDSFTLLLDELTDELTARKKQYEYYRDRLLEQGNNEYCLEDVCLIVDCPHSSPKWMDNGVAVIRNYNLVNGKISTEKLSYISEEEYVSRTKRITPQDNDILFSREAPIGNVGLIEGGLKCCQGQRVVLLRAHSNIVMPKFLIFVLQGEYVKKQIYGVEKIGSTVSNFGIGALKKLKLKLPSIDKQSEIVELLERFDEYCNDISGVLPNEINMRKKQYEYYLNKLFDFKEKELNE